MKLSLVVLTPGRSEGQIISVSLAQFVIGRDPQCNLRPASALISKRHCALLIRGEKAFIRDFDSTNGTLLNDKPVKDECELHDKDRLKVGPLLFEVRVEMNLAVNRPTPPPRTKTPIKPAEAPRRSEQADDDSIADMLLSLQDEGGTSATPPSASDIPDGSTVMEISSVPPEEAAKAKSEEATKAAKLAAQGNTSHAAKAILDKYMRRPRG
jgi:pSer/pThr/pTyr-binding forkhead associated (FHA) protein